MASLKPCHRCFAYQDAGEMLPNGLCKHCDAIVHPVPPAKPVAESSKAEAPKKKTKKK